MKVWEKLSRISNIGYNREMVVEICKLKSRCPADLEAKYHLVGNKLERFCGLGCSVNCVDEYLDLKVR